MKKGSIVQVTTLAGLDGAMFNGRRVEIGDELVVDHVLSDGRSIQVKPKDGSNYYQVIALSSVVEIEPAALLDLDSAAVVTAFNRLLNKGKIQYFDGRKMASARAAYRDFSPEMRAQKARYRLKPNEPKKLTLPDSAHKCVIDGGLVHVGCVAFYTPAILVDALQKLLSGEISTSQPLDLTACGSQGLKHPRGTMTWKDAQALLNFLEEKWNS